MKKSISDTKPKSGKDMKVFWASIEYKYKVNPVKGGFIYVFVKANSKTDAYERITKEFQDLKLSISVFEFLIQYDKNTRWHNETEKRHYMDLYNSANINSGCVFDTFYAYEHE